MTLCHQPLLIGNRYWLATTVDPQPLLIHHHPQVVIPVIYHTCTQMELGDDDEGATCISAPRSTRSRWAHTAIFGEDDADDAGGTVRGTLRAKTARTKHSTRSMATGALAMSR